MQAVSPLPAIRAFVVENLFLGDGTQLGDDDSLLEAGALDSTAVMELVAFLEKSFSIQVDNSEISPDNFDTVNRIVVFIQSKMAAAPSGE
jgi:acyl carrier protein